MILRIPDVLKLQQVLDARKILAQADWVDGRVTAGHQSAKAKNNLQIPETHPAAREIGEWILKSLEQNSLFLSAALPLKVFPPLFNQYQSGHAFGTHVDNAIRQSPALPYRVRTDLSATLFLNEPTEYDGGELCIEDTYGVHSIKLPAGHMVLYPASSLHHVKPITRGSRIASFFWIQSMVRRDDHRTLLFDLDTAIQALNRDHAEHASIIQLTGVYQNLLRDYADT